MRKNSFFYEKKPFLLYEAKKYRFFAFASHYLFAKKLYKIVASAKSGLKGQQHIAQGNALGRNGWQYSP